MTRGTCHTARLALKLCCCVALAAGFAGAALRIEIVRGEGANNNEAAGSGVAPMVRVLEDSGQPVRDALVVFTAPSTGPSLEFGGSGASASVVTGESGVASAPPGRSMGGNGPLEIHVMANRGAEFANAAIHQMNLGVGAQSAQEGEMDVVTLPGGNTGREGPRAVVLRVRVEDGKGNPVRSASVLFVLRRRIGDGKFKELGRATAVSSDEGEALGRIAGESPDARAEFMVRAEWSGSRATRYFAVAAPAQSYSAPPSRGAVSEAAPSRGFAGDWKYTPAENADHQLQFAAELIEMRITQKAGYLKGSYTARYRVTGNVSPLVSFEFEGQANGDTADLNWRGPKGAKGRITLKLVSDESMEVSWDATRIARATLVKGIGVLTRQ